jgi:ArsR family transcriptional regulator
MTASPPSPPNAAFKALGDETRREILKMLQAGPRTSGDIAAQFDSAWPTISRHLAILREGGLVMTERRGQEIYYELNTSVFQDLLQHMIAWLQPRAERPAKSRLRKRASRPQEG